MEACDRYERLTADTMARVIDDAFQAWVVRGAKDDQQSSPHRSRKSPRITGEGLPPLHIAYYSHAGETVKSVERARVVDVSADGLRLETTQAIPVGATAYFLLSRDDEDKQYGTAAVVRCDETSNGFDLGLSFVDDANSLDVTESYASTAVTSCPPRRVSIVLEQLFEHLAYIFHVITRRSPSSVLLTETHHGQDASFIASAKLFRYSVSLHVNGQKVASRNAALVDRAFNLVSDRARPTVIHLSAGGFSGWATLRANTVTACSLLPMLEAPCRPRVPQRQTRPSTAGSTATRKLESSI